MKLCGKSDRIVRLNREMRHFARQDLDSAAARIQIIFPGKELHSMVFGLPSRNPDADGAAISMPEAGGEAAGKRARNYDKDVWMSNE